MPPLGLITSWNSQSWFVRSVDQVCGVVDFLSSEGTPCSSKSVSAAQIADGISAAPLSFDL
jgi:hypothetical protein